MTPGEPVTLEKLGWQFEALEKSFTEFRAEQRDQIRALSGDVKGLTFVREDVYKSDQRAVSERMDSIGKVAASATRLAQWVLGLFCTVVIAGIFGALIKLIAG